MARELKWDPTRPRVLVVACSDGRLQEQTDAFLASQLGIDHYDRLYAPGGPGALCSSGIEYMRADSYRRECRFLLEAHDVEQMVLLFHCGSAEGPDDAMCADYRRKLPYRSVAQLRAQQESDATQLFDYLSTFHAGVQLHVYRAEVTPEGRVTFVDLKSGKAHTPRQKEPLPALSARRVESYRASSGPVIQKKPQPSILGLPALQVGPDEE